MTYADAPGFGAVAKGPVHLPHLLQSHISGLATFTNASLAPRTFNSVLALNSAQYVEMEVKS